MKSQTATLEKGGGGDVVKEMEEQLSLKTFPLRDEAPGSVQAGGNKLSRQKLKHPR